MASVTITGVRKSYGAAEVIHGIDLEIHDREFVVLVGPSGCGKSTLLRMIAGLEDITGGEIGIAGRVVNDVPSKDRDVAMVFQNYALYPHLTVRANMGFGLMLRRESKRVIRERVDATAALLGLSDYLERYPKQLSGGQRQRVAMGRAMVRSPQVFLFDEPLSNLDAKLRVQMRAEIKSLHQKVKTTSVYVTHDQIEAMTLADRVVVLKAGKVMQVGTPLELYDHPQNLFVAGFIGSPNMNFLPATLKRGDTPSALLPDRTELPLPSGVRGEEGTKIVVGLRPEHLEVSPQVAGTLSARVVVTEPTGADTLVVTELCGESVTCSTRARLDLTEGDKVALAIAPERIHVFEATTELRL